MREGEGRKERREAKERNADDARYYQGHWQDAYPRKAQGSHMHERREEEDERRERREVVRLYVNFSHQPSNHARSSVHQKHSTR